MFFGAPIEARHRRPLIDTNIYKKEQEMALIIFVLIISIPIVELSVLIDVGGEIGALSTVALCLLTAAIGLSLVKMQGMRVIADMQAKAQAGEAFGDNLIHGLFLLIAGIFLFIPGFITDFFGALLLIPFVRLALGRAGMAHMVVRTNVGGNPFGQRPDGGDSGRTSGGVTIDGEFSHTGDSEPPTSDVDVQIIPPKKDRNPD